MDTATVIASALRLAAAQYGEDEKKCKGTAPSFAERFAQQRRAALAIADIVEADGLAAVPARVNV